MSRYRQYGPTDDAPLMDGDEQFIGVNMRLEPDKVQPGFLAYGSQNLRFRHGEAETRPGVVKPAWLNALAGPVIGAAGNNYGAGTFRDPASVEWTLIAADGNIYRCRPGNARQSVPLPPGVAVLSRCSFTQAFSKLFCWRGRYLAPLVMNNVDDGFEDIEPLWDATAAYDAAVTALSTLADEVAYGPFISITTLTAQDKLATAITSVAHGYATGADLTIAGASVAGFNGRVSITVLDEFTFRYQIAGNGGSQTAAGATCSNMSLYWKALGSQIVPTALTWAANVVTVTKAGHGFSTGQYVTIAGATPAAYDGTYAITVTSSSQFTFALVETSLADATGCGTATSSAALAGQSPDTHPEAWQQIYNVLPNADDAVYMNNRLIVPTAYTPDSSGAYNSAACSYTKKDYLVATDILDYIHFDFVGNEFRINAGDDDEIQALVVYNMTTLMVFKGKSWGILGGIGLDLSNVTLNMFGATYGACALRSAVTAGADVIFPSSKRGLCSCYMTQLGQIRGTDTPFSNEMEKVVGRINWNYAAAIRLAWWDDKLYAAVPLDDAEVRSEMPWTAAPTMNFSPVNFNTLRPGAQYWYDGEPGATLKSGAVTLSAAGYFVAPQSQAQVLHYGGNQTGGKIYAVTHGNNALMVYDYRMGFSGNVLTYDFRGGQWAGIDTGPLGVLEFFKATVNGLERLCYIGADGFASMLEEAVEGDQVYDGQSPMGLSFAPIQTAAVTRGYRTQDPKTPEGQRKWQRLNIVAGTWNPCLTLTANTGAAFSGEPLADHLAFDRVSYFKPATRAKWDPANAAADFQTPGRYDYSVALAPGGTVLTGGMNLSTMQEFTKRVSLRPLTGRYAQFTLACSQGRMRFKAPAGEAVEGTRRNGAVI